MQTRILAQFRPLYQRAPSSAIHHCYQQIATAIVVVAFNSNPLSLSVLHRPILSSQLVDGSRWWVFGLLCSDGSRQLMGVWFLCYDGSWWPMGMVLRFDGLWMRGRRWVCWDFVWLGLVIGFCGCFNKSVWFNEFPLMGWWIWMVFGSNGVCCVWSLIVQLAWVWLFLGMKFMVLIFWDWICWVCSWCSWCSWYQIFHLLGWNLSLGNLSSMWFFFSLILHQTYTSWTSSLLNSILGWNSIFPNSSSKNSVHN